MAQSPVGHRPCPSPCAVRWVREGLRASLRMWGVGCRSLGWRRNLGTVGAQLAVSLETLDGGHRGTSCSGGEAWGASTVTGRREEEEPAEQPWGTGRRDAAGGEPARLRRLRLQPPTQSVASAAVGPPPPLSLRLLCLGPEAVTLPVLGCADFSGPGSARSTSGCSGDGGDWGTGFAGGETGSGGQRCADVTWRQGRGLGRVCGLRPRPLTLLPRSGLVSFGGLGPGRGGHPGGQRALRCGSRRQGALPVRVGAPGGRADPAEKGLRVGAGRAGETRAGAGSPGAGRPLPACGGRQAQGRCPRR